MNARDQLQQVIDERQGRLASGEFPDREAALLALVERIDHAPTRGLTAMAGPCLGAASALSICLNTENAGTSSCDPSEWALAFLAACRDLEAAKLVARFAGAGEMRLATTSTLGFEAWITGDRVPSLWLERADLAAWPGADQATIAPSLGTTASGAELVAGMSCQLPYPTTATIGDISIASCRIVLAEMVDTAADLVSVGTTPVVFDEPELIEAISASVGIATEETSAIIAALTLDAGNAAWHGALPGGPLAPLVRVSPRRLALCRRGLTTEPLLFLTRELRRRDPERYHNAAHQREDAFRDDLAAIFPDSRFVTSPGRIVMRRDDRRHRTDVDAAIFDRKTSTLALFEMKSHDPFARTVDELVRQRENLARAGHQVAAMLDWINRHGADEVLNRMDRATAKRFRVQRVLPFVLGRYLAETGQHRNDRVAWGSWGQVVRLLDEIQSSNPLLSLHDRLAREVRSAHVALPARINLGSVTIDVRDGWDE